MPLSSYVRFQQGNVFPGSMMKLGLLSVFVVVVNVHVDGENQVLNLIVLLLLKNEVRSQNSFHYLSSIEHCYGDQKALFNIADGLLHKSRMPALPQHASPKVPAGQFMDIFISKITKIKSNLNFKPRLLADLASLPSSCQAI